MAQVENESGQKLKCLKFDNRGKYCDSKFEEFCASRRIRKVRRVPKNPHQNKATERMKMTIILEHSRSMRIHAGLPKQFWVDAVNTALYLINRGASVPLNCGVPQEA